MRFADRVLRVLAEHPEGLSDGEIAAALHVNHAQANLYCRHLAREGRIERDDLARPIRNRLLEPDRPVPAEQHTGTSTEVDRRERTVQDRVVAWLVAQRWRIVRVADTDSRERGTDIRAERDGVLLHVEVKGYPSTSYADPRRADEIKPTRPATQARQWFGGAVVKVLQLRQEHPDDEVAFAFPDVPTYRALISTIETTVATMRLAVFFVRDDGLVDARWAGPA
ncbi:helix-turn-helix domain-containing protein [Saccharothrix sp. S26]|uniref:helix-turn-helix domain-containing protein n=1 Tax=Saccharothrix sp. S26 TaxID=2907215 RepID=UPI001F38732A|nr:helix-turn-helix domain-containing protein [Saccharothrix sp. S26]MCE6999825.1 helix-turn-helix domain-containing protein [Saccharothrix sp. S26]